MNNLVCKCGNTHKTHGGSVSPEGVFTCEVCIKGTKDLPKCEKFVQIDIDNIIEKIQDFFLQEDNHYFDDLETYMSYRANQITMIIENNTI